MAKNRLEGFSDGVLAVIITIMVLELKVPHGADLDALRPLLPVFLSYVLSFVFIGIYWSNHHHLMHAAARVSGAVLWANLHILFWLALVPFTTAWMGENGFAALPVAIYGAVQLMAGFAFFVLTRSLIAANGRESTVSQALGRDLKGRVSLFLYAIGVLLAFVSTPAALGLYVAVALMWLVPDRRFERALDR